MKKVYKISIFALALFATLSMTAHSFSLSVNGADSGSFAIAQMRKSYYLKGSFNDWEASNDYELEDVSETMTPEEGKIKEYSITKELHIGETLKMWDNTNRWYSQGENGCSYGDKWSRSTNPGADYVIPMTATYTFFLKLYDNGASQVYVSAPDITTLYLKPNANWLSDGARFAAYFFNETENTWVNMVEDNDNYKVVIPEGGYTTVIFCRMNGGNEVNDWSNKWNQTGNLSIDYRTIFEVPDGSWDVEGDTNWMAV